MYDGLCIDIENRYSCPTQFYLNFKKSDEVLLLRPLLNGINSETLP